MKTTQHLSTFQKQQYTLYLETQLEKFSAFMLTHKKDNERTKHLEDLIEVMTNTVHNLTERIKMLEFYQQENFKQCERMQTDNAKTVDIDYRLKKVQSRYFERPVEGKAKENNPNASNYGKSYSHQLNELEKRIDLANKENTLKIRKIEKQIQNLYSIQQKLGANERANFAKRESQPILTNYSQVNSVQNLNTPQSQAATKSELKATENKIYTVFDKKFSRIQQIIHKSFREKSKSSKKKSLNSSNNSSNILMKEQTFGMEDPSNSNRRVVHKNQRQHTANYETIRQDDYQLSCSQVKNSMNEKSYSISDTSQRLKPVTYHVQFEGEIGKDSRASKKQRRSSKQKRKSRSISKSASRSKSKSKSKLSNMETKTKKAIRQSKNESNFSPYTERQEKSQSKSVGKSSRSGSRRNQKTKNGNSSKPKSRKRESKQYNSNKQYLMNCTKDHVRSYK